jgi:2-polyprenyl-3-methyl-5-hydroxy-6-metoxy-1,4-benzoquinol methylase
VDNTAARQLIDLGIVSPGDWERVGVTRDRPDISVLRCRRSGVLFLETSQHIDLEYYEHDYDPRPGTLIGERYERPTRSDDLPRRSEMLRPLVREKSWLDFGAGWGEVLRELADHAGPSVAVEPSRLKRNSMQRDGIRAVKSVEELAEERFNIVTMFHVLEHLVDPAAAVDEVRTAMSDGATLVVEIPHARDALISLFRSEEFAAFTYWSQHLVLHTRESLAAVLGQAGFTDVSIRGYQRYGVANHLYWLAEGRPGGHAIWTQISGRSLDEAYEAALAAIDASDTLVAYARKA